MRLRKLKGMTGAELWGRVRIAGSQSIEEAAFRLGRLTPPDRLRRALRPSLSNPPDWTSALHARRADPKRPRFFVRSEDRGRFQDLFASEYSQSGRATAEAAARACAHEYTFFGETFRIPAPVDWHLDPPSGRRWPLRFHARIPVAAGDVGWGDVKHVWELNRQQFLIDLGKAFYLNNDTRAAREVRTLVADWIAQNPYACGVNWASPLEPAYRALSWLWAYELCAADHELAERAHLEWLTSFYDHARFLSSHLELFASPFNHLIGEAAALFILGVSFPEFRDAGAWRRQGRDVLESRLPEQFYADGGSVEQATFYHHATLGFYLLAALHGRAHGHDLSRDVWSALERACEYSMWMTQPDGRVPSFGDTDDGKPIRFEHRPFWDFRSLLAAGAVLFDRPDFKHVAGDTFHEDALWLLGPDGRERFLRLRSVAPARTSVFLPASGYSVLRSDWSPSADYMCFDCGELAGGIRTDDVPSAAHGHADCLSVVLVLSGQPVLVDPGFFTYNGAEAWERHFRETVAHNTIRIAGRDQALHLRKMAWAHAFAPSGLSCEIEPAEARSIAAHDGYAKAAPGIVHRRSVWLRPHHYAVISDELLGEAGQPFELTFQFPGRAQTTHAGSTVTVDSRFQLGWDSSVPLDARVRCGGPDPADGWIAESLGVRVAAPKLTLAGITTGSCTRVLSVVTDLASWPDGVAAGREYVAHSVELLPALRLSGGGREELIEMGGEAGRAFPVAIAERAGDTYRPVIFGGNATAQQGNPGAAQRTDRAACAHPAWSSNVPAV